MQVVEFIVDPTSQLQAQTVPAMLRNVGRTRLNVEPHVQLNCAVNRTWEIVEQLLTEVVTVADDNSDIKEKVQKRMIFAAAHYLGRCMPVMLPSICDSDSVIGNISSW